MIKLLLVIYGCLTIICCNGSISGPAIINSFKINKQDKHLKKFPENFSIGASTAAYQIGAWNEDGKSPSIWDSLTHNHPELIVDHSNGDIGPDSYHFYKADIESLKKVGFQHYRFSIAWSRILPDGSKVNQQAVNYYNALIEELIINDIEPMVTMHHYDLPQYLQDLGGFTNPLIIDYFREYARVLFKEFGDRVRLWITFNEPIDQCVDGYGTGRSFSLINATGIGEYLCAHFLLQAHAEVYHLYRDEFYNNQHGKIGISLDSRYFFQNRLGFDEDACNRALQFNLGWFAHPIFSSTGGYPNIMIERINKRSKEEQRPWSRLPEMSNEIKKRIQGSADFFGLNYYTSRLTTSANDSLPRYPPSFDSDADIAMFVDPSWKRATSDWLYMVPEGLYKLLLWIKNEYKNPEIIITENGWSDNGTSLEDNDRVEYILEHIKSILRAIDDGVNVTGYTIWSIIDNFEWLRGYSEKFGIFSVNMTSPIRERIPKTSWKAIHDIIKNGGIF